MLEENYMKKIIIKSLLASTLLSLVLINNTEVASAATNSTAISASKTFEQQKDELVQKFYAAFCKGEISQNQFGSYLRKLSTCTNETEVAELANEIENINVDVLAEAQNEAKSVLLRMKNENKISAQVFKDASRAIDKTFNYKEVDAILKQYQTAYNGLSFLDVKKEMIDYNLKLANTYRISGREFNLNLFNISTATSITELQDYFFYHLANK